MSQHSASATTELKSSKINRNWLKIYEATDIPILRTEKLRTKILMVWREKTVPSEMAVTKRSSICLNHWRGKVCAREYAHTKSDCQQVFVRDTFQITRASYSNPFNTGPVTCPVRLLILFQQMKTVLIRAFVMARSAICIPRLRSCRLLWRD